MTFKANEIAAEIVAGDTRLMLRPMAVRRSFPFMESVLSKFHACETSDQEDNLLKSTIFSVNLQLSPRRSLCDIYDA